VHHRFLPLRLLAPTVLMSLGLVAACITAAISLRRQYVDMSTVLNENVDSILAAKELETTLTELLQQLRGQEGPPDPRLAEDVDKRLAAARQQLVRTRELANHEHERRKVQEIAQGLASFEALFRQPTRPPAAELAANLEKGALPACAQLLRDNAEQVGHSDRENRRIVNLLTWGLLLVGIGAPLAGLLLGYSIARRVHQSIYQLSVRIRDAAGKLNGETHPITLEDTGDLAGLGAQMQGIVGEIEAVFQRLQQREREVLRADQLAAVGQVAAGVAHELRNPLTSVKMLVQTGLEGPEPSGLSAEDLSIIEHEVRRMEGCIQTFLNFARPPSAERRRTDLNAVVRRALALVEGRARRQQVACTAELPPHPVALCIDGEQIHQVLVNLLLNALDALPHGGRVRVTVGGPTAETRAVTVRVEDTGPGIPPAIKARLFEPFVSGKETGLGLGLSICRRLVEAHGGSIRGDNVPPGAVFTFTLPADEEPSEMGQGPEAGEAPAAARSTGTPTR
jgi:signal transduction histidine kinase